MCDSTQVELFYGFVKLNTQPNLRWFYDKIEILRQFT